MKGIFNDILDGLQKGDFLETDGTSYWWVNQGSYKEITRKTFSSFVKDKYVHAKKIDDETTCFYLSTQEKDSGEIITPREESVNEYKLNQIRSFINL